MMPKREQKQASGRVAFADPYRQFALVGATGHASGVGAFSYLDAKSAASHTTKNVLTVARKRDGGNENTGRWVPIGGSFEPRPKIARPAVAFFRRIMQSCGVNSQWFAVRTASGREKSVATQLQAKGFEEFLPIYRTRRQWSDRTKELELPLFPGYLFCRFNYNDRLPILVTPGVKVIVGFGRTPTPVSEIEIENLRRVVASGVAAEPHQQYLTVGERVRIREGSLAGVEGILVDVKNSWRIVLSVELLQRSVSVELDRAAIEPVLAKRAAGNRPVALTGGASVNRATS